MPCLCQKTSIRLQGCAGEADHFVKFAEEHWRSQRLYYQSGWVVLLKHHISSLIGQRIATPMWYVMAG